MNIIENKYYSLKEISPLVNLKYRQLKTRITIISKKYENRKDLIYKKCNRWFIHFSILKEFKRQRNPIDYKLFITIASKNQFDIDYWKYFINQRLNKTLKKIDASTRVKYVIERHKSGIYHLHFMTNFAKETTLRKLLREDYITDITNDMNINIKDVNDVKTLHKYFRKQNRPVLLK